MGFCGYLKQSTAVDILLGPFVDDTDGTTAETGLTLDVEVSKNGQALANKSDATAPVHDAAATVTGYYNCELDATDTGTLGLISVVAHAAGFLPVHQTYQIVVAHWYDTMCSTDYLQVDMIQVGGTAQTANDNGADIDAILVATGTTLPATLAGLNDVSVTDITQRQIPDSYGADGSRPTIEQALLMIWQFLSERAVTTTTVSVKKPDGSTEAMTFTLNDATDPTSITRAS